MIKQIKQATDTTHQLRHTLSRGNIFIIWVTAKSPAIWCFVQQLVQADDNENAYAQHYCPSKRGIHRWPLETPHKRPVMRNAFIECYTNIKRHTKIRRWFKESRVCFYQIRNITSLDINALWSSDAMWRYMSGSDNGFLLNGTKSLPVPMLTSHKSDYVAFYITYPSFFYITGLKIIL